MGIQFAPHDGFPVLLDTRVAPPGRGWPLGWWILPAMISRRVRRDHWLGRRMIVAIHAAPAPDTKQSLIKTMCWRLW